MSDKPNAPINKQDTNEEYSEMEIELTADEYAALERLAKKNNRSVNDEVVEVLRDGVEKVKRHLELEKSLEDKE